MHDYGKADYAQSKLHMADEIAAEYVLIMKNCNEWLLRNMTNLGVLFLNHV